MNRTSLPPDSSSSSPSNRRLWGLAILLGFLLLAWGLWLYFDWKIQSLDAALAP